MDASFSNSGNIIMKKKQPIIQYEVGDVVKMNKMPSVSILSEKVGIIIAKNPSGSYRILICGIERWRNVYADEIWGKLE